MWRSVFGDRVASRVGDRWLEIKGQIGERHHGERHDGERHHGERQHGERHHGERHHGERHHGEGHHGEGHHGEGHQVRRDRTAREHKHKQTHAKTLLGARGQEEGRNCSASIQTSTLEKDKVSGSKSEDRNWAETRQRQASTNPKTKSSPKDSGIRTGETGSTNMHNGREDNAKASQTEPAHAVRTARTPPAITTPTHHALVHLFSHFSLSLHCGNKFWKTNFSTVQYFGKQKFTVQY